jgi:histidinol-phosphate aminotransferase
VLGGLNSLIEADVVLYLNKNELPWPPPSAVVRAAAETSARPHEYPPLVPDALVAALARFHSVDPLRLAVGDGSAKVLVQILRAVCAPSEEVVFATPGFDAYPGLVRLAGAVPVGVPLRDNQIDLDAIIDRARVGNVRVVVLCNPHNPTGVMLSTPVLEQFLDRIPPTMMVVLDEAYREFAVGPDGADDLAVGHNGFSDRRNVVVLRTFSKAYGLAGLRVGYCVAPQEVALRVRQYAVPYSVTQAAQSAAIAALDAGHDFTDMWLSVASERGRVRRALLTAGFTVPQSRANFLWIDLGSQAEELRDSCADHNVVVCLYPNCGVRVSIGRVQDNDAFLAAAVSFAGC